MIEIRLIWAWLASRAAALREADRDSGVETLSWVVLTALIVAAAIAVAAIIIAKAKSAANNIQLQ
jgi:hypothetical protein